MQPQYLYSAVITKVVDGDTLDATVDLGFNIFTNIRFRLYGLDTPEIHSADPTLRATANKAKQLVETLLNKSVTIKTYKPDKYGRWLAEIYIDGGSSINKQLLEQNLAVPYFGGTK